MERLPLITLTSLVLAIAGIGCKQPVVCDLCSTSAVVRGTVRRTNGASVPNALVSAVAHRDSCAGAEYASGTPVRTGADGTYQVNLRTSAGPFLACVVVHVSPPDGSGLQAVDASGATVLFRADYGGNTLHDSVTVDLILPDA